MSILIFLLMDHKVELAVFVYRIKTSICLANQNLGLNVQFWWCSPLSGHAGVNQVNIFGQRRLLDLVYSRIN
jgi:hypothetical protein